MSKEIEEIKNRLECEYHCGEIRNYTFVNLPQALKDIRFLLPLVSTLEERVKRLVRDYEIEKTINVASIENCQKADRIIKRLEERVRELQKQIDFQIKNYLADHELMKEYRTKWEQAESRIKEIIGK